MLTKIIHFYYNYTFTLFSMTSFVSRIAILLLFSVFTILCYYLVFPFHAASSDLTLIYIAIILFLYVCYKGFYIGLGYKKITFTPFSLFLLFVLHLFILSYLLFFSSGVSGVFIFSLVFRIIGYIWVISIFCLLILSLGKTILTHILPDFSKRDTIFQNLVSFWLGFSIFWWVLSIIAIVWWYTSTSILVLLWTTVIVSYKQFWNYLQEIWNHRIEFENHNLSSTHISGKICPYLLTTEFLFFIATLVICVSFISVIRPFPIGWDDLWAYMNHPKLLSVAWWNIAIGKMYLWELFTGIGFLFNSQTFAFFINSFSAVTAFLVTYFWSKLILPKIEKPAINIHFLIATIYTCMPMVIFQVAKDMKLDIALYTISFLTIIITIYVYIKNDLWNTRERYIYFFIIGILIGTAFIIKITSLLLLLWIIAIVSFYYLQITGLFAYICIFISIFTFFGLWTLMKVFVPESSILVYTVSCIFGVVGIGLLVKSISQSSKKIFFQLVKSLGTICIGMLIILIPWQIKNISESLESGISVGKMLSWVKDKFSPDYSEIYTPDELANKEKTLNDRTVSRTWSTQNEDFGRYFWYEKGINNYLKLPWNLTMQVNQRGEFTDITYIFFALIPAIFLFLPFRRTVYIFPIIGVLLLEILYFFPSPISSALTNIFATIVLPGGYIFLFLPLVVSFWYFYHCLDRKLTTSKLFLSVYAFTSLYYFLWSIAAFGIVWYGIAMYGAFLLLISISLLSVFEREKHKDASILSYVLFGIIAFYFFQSTVPNALTNLKKAGNIPYKTWQITQYQWLFQAHPEYLDILFAVNIDNDKKQDFLEWYKNAILKELEWLRLDKNLLALTNNTTEVTAIEYLLKNLPQLQSADQASQMAIMQKNITSLQEEFYTDIIAPSLDVESNAGIYRVGTFLKYFITKNNSRLLEDSLLTAFDTYIYDPQDNSNSFTRMKKLGIEYLLIDLNAATIDQDPRKDLTRRYENLLVSLISENIELIKTDSICLQLGWDVYKRENNKDVFLQIAGVNHRGISPCLNAVYQIIHSDQLQYYSYLSVYKNRIDADISEQTPIYLAVRNQLIEQKAILSENNPDIQNSDVTDAEIYVALLGRYINQWFKALFQIQ